MLLRRFQKDLAARSENGRVTLHHHDVAGAQDTTNKVKRVFGVLS
jgi:hypothetical protein